MLLSITKNCETLIEQTHTRAGETLEFKLIKPREIFSFRTPSNLGLDSKWMIVLTTLEVYLSVFITTKDSNNFEFYTDSFDEFSFADIKEEFKETLGLSDITPTHLQHDLVGPHTHGAYEILGSEKLSTDIYLIIMMGYARSPLRDFES